MYPDGKGQQKKDGSVIRGTADTVGWVKEEDGWHYRYPDGSLGRGGWELIDGLWYYFNMDGLMLTGWQNVDGRYYYLSPTGRWQWDGPGSVRNGIISGRRKRPGNPWVPWPGQAGR